MSQKNILAVTNNEKIKKQLPTNEETKDSLEKDEVKIVVYDDNEQVNNDFNKREVRKDDCGNIEANAIKASNPDGQLVGRQSQPASQPATQPTTQLTSQPVEQTAEQPQNVYLGGNPYYFMTPYLQQPKRNDAEQPPNNTDDLLIQYNPETRNSFIKYILTIVFIMLLMTSAFIALVLAVPSVKDCFSKNRLVILIPTLFIIFAVNYAMTCLVPCTRHPPCNIIFLFFSVVGMSLLCGLVTSYYSTQIVLYAFVATTAVVFVCILLACSNFDFTSYLLYVIVLVTAFSVVVLIILMTMMVAKVTLKPAFIAFLVIATLLQVMILTIHLQTIIGGRTIELNDQDYALGAYMLYMSIIDIFMKMVFMFGISSEM